MSNCIVWSIPNEVIEAAIKNSLHLEVAPVVWAAGLDEVMGCVNVAVEIDESDMETMYANMGDMELTLAGDGGLIQ
jgi:hypothetical protein